MRFLSTALFASGVMAAAVGRSDDCILSNRHEMAADASCGDFPALDLCFSELASSDATEVANCYIKAGCSETEAHNLAGGAAKRCTELFGTAELKRRYRAVLEDRAPAPTAVAEIPAFPMTTNFWEQHGLLKRSATSGGACFRNGTTETESCDVQTDGDRVSTQGCSQVVITTSDCNPGMTCSRDRAGLAVCMDVENNLDVGGIIVTIIFGVAIVLGIATITFLCCKDRKEQKRLAAKAEATALVRAATKKKRDAETRAQRAPLMQHQQGGDSGPERPRDASTGSTDPFHDRNRS
jgi:hypothetical protein